ncbi:T6SS immunity protein Tli4 family protein [Luteimonas salinilitoris]|uniref:T6SS immunity protein Tli4 family protein n=1 Tax=Luteimonas salinilitoris TaxID=3237697 RepID=A0ABV4HPR5_9GAMM
MKGTWLCAAIAAALALAGCKPMGMEQKTVAELTKSMRTICIGRHLIGLPETFRQNYRSSSVTLYFGHDADFETVEAQVVNDDVEPEQFASSMKQRRAEISGEINEKTQDSMLLLEEGVGENGVLIRYHKSDISNRSHIHELHLLVSGVQVFMKAESYNGVIEPVENRLKKLAASVQAVPDPKSAGAGFCLGPVVIDANNDYELAAFRFRDESRAHRDVSLDVELNTFKQDVSEPRLIRRVETNFSGLGFSPKTLRKERAEFAGMPAEEWLGSHESDGRIEHSFSIESYPASPALASPVLQLQLMTGGAVPNQPTTGLPPYGRPSRAPGAGQIEEVGSSLTDDEAVGVWDRIVKSVRPRPNAVKS